MAHIFQIKTTIENNLNDPVILTQMLGLLNNTVMTVEILEDTEILVVVYDLRANEKENVRTAATRLFQKWREIYRRQKVQYTEISSSGLPFTPASFKNNTDPYERSDTKDTIVID